MNIHFMFKICIFTTITFNTTVFIIGPCRFYYLIFIYLDKICLHSKKIYNLYYNIYKYIFMFMI